jgi:hypothetical protein
LREIPLSKGYVTLVDDEDYAWLQAHKWTAVVTGGGARVYAYRRESWDQPRRRWTRTVYMHRQILAMANDNPMDVDHIDNNTLNNQRSNLRIVTRSQNLARKRWKRGVTGYRGVTPETGGGFRAQCCGYYIGHFTTSEAAAYAFDAYVLNRFGEFASLNFPQESQHNAG